MATVQGMIGVRHDGGMTPADARPSAAGDHAEVAAAGTAGDEQSATLSVSLQGVRLRTKLLVAFGVAFASVVAIAVVKVGQTAVAGRAGWMVEDTLEIDIALVVFAAVAVGGAALWAMRSISQPLLRLGAAMERLGAGDLDVAIDIDGGRSDEIGAIALAANGYRKSLIESRRLAAEAEAERRRFELAITGMPIGLAVFDRNRRLVLSNRRYGDMYDLRPALTRPGTRWEDIIRERVRLGIYVGSDPEAYVEAAKALVARPEPYAEIVEYQDGRVFSINLQPTGDGGWVTTHEDVTAQRHNEARIAHLTRHDSLTDLPNRTHFRDRLDEAIRRGDPQPVVLCLDLDRFQTVNETLGHPIGDLLLKAAGERLRACVRDNDLIARIGGDEFAILQSDQRQPGAVIALAQRVVERLGAPFMVGGHQVVIGVSVGVAMAPDDGDTADRLMKSADQALYRAKAEGGAAYRFFEAEMDARMRARHRLETDLRQALIRQEFEVYYQPIVKVARNAISGFEALVRWAHPGRGIIQPDEFIPLAEEIGLIVPLGEWVLRRACADAALWPKEVKVAVNLSAVQFRSGRILQAVITALASSGLAGNRLELEVTESTLLAENAATTAALHQLRGLGVRVCMDDFGTGYSSLAYLRSFPFDKIKIDRSFIQDLGESANSLAILKVITGLGASLGMTTTAEGVETQAQFDLVKAEGCDEVQGTMIAEPVPADGVAAILDRFRGRDVAAA